MRDLTAEQEQAVARRQGPLALTAGAGSGKTTVLVERFVRAVHEDGIAPARILAITFTERASGELRERIRARLTGLGHRDGAREAEGAFIGTFHGFCARLLRAHPLAAGVDPRFRVVDEGIAGRVRRLAFREALAGFVEPGREDAVDLLAAYGPGPLEEIVVDVHGALRSQGSSSPGLPPLATSAEERGEAGRALIDELLQAFATAYMERKRRTSMLDFDDLELYARDLLRAHPAIRTAWSERFELLMVDEFQDTNRRQLELLELLERDNLFTVGDELQAIYGFRHAEVGLFRERRERLAAEGRALALTHNFRSRPPILGAVDRAFKARLGESYTPLTAARTQDAAEQPAVELLLTDCRGWEPSGEARFQGAGADGVPESLDDLPQATPWRRAEARLLAARLAELIGDGAVLPGEVAVLLRSLSDLPLYEAALRAVGLPTLASTGGFWGHRQIGDLLAYLRTLANPLDELALYSTLASPFVGVSSDGLVVLARLAKAHGCSAWLAIERHGEEVELALGAADRERIRAFRGWFSAERRERALLALPALIRRAIAAAGYDRHVLSLQWGERRMANVYKLIRLARRYEAQEGRDLRGFLDHAAHLGEAFAGREAEAPAGAGQAEAVQLMSVHAAKGLEFAVVCVADLGRAPRLGVGDLIAEREGRLGLRLRVLGQPEPLAVGEYEALADELRLAQQAEEDRILYVAMTRARDRLLLSGAADFARWPAPRHGAAPIGWLAAALVPDLQGLLAVGEDAVCDLGDGLSLRCIVNVPGADRAASVDRGARAVSPDRGAEEGPADDSAADDSATTPSLVELEKAWPTVRRAEAPVAAAVPSDPDATISYTYLAELERCGYRHYLERVLRLAEDTDARDRRARGLDARTRGTIVHLLLERVDFARPEPPAAGRVAELARSIGVRLSPAQRAEVCVLVEGALGTAFAERLASATTVGRELPFAFSIGQREPLVTGVFDLLARERDGSLLIVDYKSDRLQEDDDLEEVVERDYGLQRLLYGLAGLEQGAERVEVAHWFLERPDGPASVSFAAAGRAALHARLVERLGELRAKGFAVSERPHRALCLSCPGRAGLCSWSEQETLGERPDGPPQVARLATLTP